MGLLLGPEPSALRALRLAWFDAYHAVAPRSRTSAPVAIVEIDEVSLARHGQWPWPRTLLAQLVSRIAAGDPAAIGVDILMPEPDRLSPSRLSGLVPGIPLDLTERLSRLPSSDAVLADVLRGKPVVLGVLGLVDGDGPPVSITRRAPVRVQGGEDPMRFVLRFGATLRSLDVIDEAAAGHGLLNPDPRDPVVRRIPLVAAAGGALLPSLGLEMLRVATGASAFSVRTGRGGVEGVGVGDLFVPTQPDATVWIHYAPHDPGRFVSAADVLTGAVDPEQFSRRLVLLGVTAVGLGDHHATPVAARMAGTEIHAQLLEGIFDGDLLSRPRWAPWVEAVILAGGGLLLVLAVPALAARRAAALLLLLVGATLALGVVLYHRGGVLFDAASPAAGLALLYAVLLAIALAEADSQRRALRQQLQREREGAAQLAGELEAARRIQMGILPDAANAFPGETRFSLYAFLEPARVVGGDLYDFFRLDEDRLFVLIGDVSGKGVPGSLFMAVSKALYKSAVLRRAGEVGILMREANVEVSRDNPELLFVTAFAGILDARTGDLDYCNAGHEVPCLVSGDGGGVTHLTEGGGPPLCTVEGFPYEGAAYRMRPGETLCLVTDGVTEAMNPAGELYGRKRLDALLAALGGAATAGEVGRGIERDIKGFVAGAEPSDDLAIVVLQWNGPAPSVGAHGDAGRRVSGR